MTRSQHITHAEVTADIEAIYNKIEKIGGIKDVFCVGCGGSLANLYPLEYLLRSESKSIHAESITGNEFVYDAPERMGKNSLVVLLSATGGTPETCAAAKTAKSAGATVITISGKADAPLHENGDYKWNCSVDILDSETYDRYNSCLVLQLGFELLRLYDDYSYYDEAMNAIDLIPQMHKKLVRQISQRTIPFGEAHKADKVIYTVASGPSLFAGYMQSICLFMEMEWVNSFCIHAGEMFHGPFEVADNNTPFVVFLSNGRTRIMDERALKFLERYSGRVTVIDSNELGVSIVGPNVEEYFSGVLNWVAAYAYGKGLAVAKDHPFGERRYMGQIEY